MKKISATLFSMTSTGVLLGIFAFAIAYATFIENDYGTVTARILVYNALWFEVLLFLLAVNLVGSIFHYGLWSGKKPVVVLFHGAFLVILAGSAITRYTGFEGSLHIREGEMNNQLVTGETYVTVTATDGTDTLRLAEEVRFSPYTSNRFRAHGEIGGRKLSLKNLKFVPSAAESVVEDPSGEPMVALMAVDRFGRRYDLLLRQGESALAGEQLFTFSPQGDSSSINIMANGELVFFSSPDSVFLTGMQQQELTAMAPDTLHPLTERMIYQTGTTGFVLKKYHEKGKAELVYVPDHAGSMSDDALHLAVTLGGESRELFVFGSKGTLGRQESVTLGGVSVNVSYGSVVHELPFSLRLNDFQIERYPGSDSPSSFASELTLVDTGHSVERPFRIFMNNILKYKGYRFFQSSFDEDEKGTILSVNYDWLGTMVTYAGYFLMTLGMVLALFSRRSRFSVLARASARLGRERRKLFPVLLAGALFFPAITAVAQQSDQHVAPGHARDFGTLLVQSNDGRIEPINTLASEVLRKVAKKGSFNGLSPVQVMLDMMLEPEKWRNIPVIKVGDAGLRRILSATDGYVSFNSVLSGHQGEYKLREYVDQAYAKRPAERSKFDKEVVNVDERVNILYKFMTGAFLTIFPVPGDAANKWLSPADAAKSPLPEVAQFSSQVLGDYFAALKGATISGNYSDAGVFLLRLKENQQKLGAAIYPPAIKTHLEIFYTNFNIYSKLSKVYIIAGLLLLVLQFVSLLSSLTWPRRWEKSGFWVVLILLLIHTAGLAIRWYISGHAPWSNGYETLLYISWATCLTGLFFARRSPMTLAVTTILAAISLFVAGMSWMNPELTNLVPVLKSYWLVIHVAVITASYGFFAMAALLGVVNLVLIIIDAEKSNPRIGFTLRELVLIIEMAMIAGLYMLTIGSFLGGVWANESWGRYWGWDPKETWAMVTILVYAFIVHMHKIPGFRGTYALSVATLAGLASVLMTFFGVNYYLSGLHSYAQGEPVPVPTGVYIAIAVVVVLAVTSLISDKKRRKVNPELPGEPN